MARPTTVLLIDDDPDLVRLLERCLRREFREQIDLTAMSNSVAAKIWIQRNRPTVVITDLDMPCVGGLELVVDAKASNPSATIIVFSGRAEEHAHHVQANHGIEDCIPKSGDFDRLLAAIHKALAGRRDDSPVVAEPLPPSALFRMSPATCQTRGGVL